MMDTGENDGLSIVIPVYNETYRLKRTLNTLFYNSIFIQDVFSNLEIIIVNDGSKNDIKSIVKQQKDLFHDIFVEMESDFKIKFVSYSINKGKGYAIKTGVKYCSNSMTWLMDADLSIPLQDFITGSVFLLSTNIDVVVGNRKHNDSIVTNYSWLRLILSKQYNKLISKHIFKDKKNVYTDVQCPCKIALTHKLKKICNAITVNGFCYDTEMLMLMIINKYKIKQIPVTFVHDSKDSKVKLVSSSLKMLRELIKIKKRFNGL